MKSIKQLIIDRIRKPRKYTPKFVVGDIILNKKFKVVRRIEEIVLSLGDETGEFTQYRVIDLSNPYKDKKNLNYPRSFKYCTRIDDFYDKIPEHTAKVLYGVKI